MGSRIYYGDIEGYFPEALSLTFLNIDNNQKMIFSDKTPVFMEYKYKSKDITMLNKVITSLKGSNIFNSTKPEILILYQIKRHLANHKSCRFMMEL